MSVTSYLSSTPTLKDFESTGDTLDDIVTDLELETHLLVNDSSLLEDDPLEVKSAEVQEEDFDSLELGPSSPGLDSLPQSLNEDETLIPVQESQDESNIKVPIRRRKRRRNCPSSDGAAETNIRNYPQRIRKASVRILDYITDDTTKQRDQSKRPKKPKKKEEEPEESGDIEFISESIPLRDSHSITATLRPAYEPKSKKQSPKRSPTKRSSSEGFNTSGVSSSVGQSNSGNEFGLVTIKKEKTEEDDETLTSLCEELSDNYSPSDSMDLLNVKVKNEPETYDMVPSSLIKTEDTFSDTIDDFAMDIDQSALSDGESETKPSLPLLRVKTDLFNPDSEEPVELKTEEDSDVLEDDENLPIDPNRPLKTISFQNDENARQPSVYSTVLEHSYAARRKVRINNNLISYCIVCHKVCDSSYVHKPMCTMRVFNCSHCIFQSDNVHAMQQHMITIHDLQVFNVFVSAPALPASASVDSAVKAVSEGIDPFAVSKLFNIHFRFLKAKLREVGVHFVLDDKKEKELANHLYLLKKLGFVFTEYSVRKIAYEFAFENDWEQVHPIKWAGAGWFSKFTERYPCFMDSSPKFANLVAENIYHKGLINNFFDQFVRSSFGHQFHPENIYTVDTSLVFIDDRKRVGVAFAMNGVGDMVPPYIASNFHLLPSNSPVIAEMDQAYGRITSSIFDRFISTLATHILGKTNNEEILILLCGNNYVAQSAHVFKTLKGAGLSVLSIPSSLQKPFSVRLLGQILKNMQVTIDENTAKGFKVEPSQFTEIFWRSCRKPTPTLEDIACRGYEECGIIPYNKNLALSLLETQGSTNHCYRLIFGGKKSEAETLEPISQLLKKPIKPKPARPIINGIGKNSSRMTSDTEGTTEKPTKKTKFEESVSHLMNLNRKISPKTSDTAVKERIIVRSLPKKRSIVKTRVNSNQQKKIEQPFPPDVINESSSSGSTSSHEEGEPDCKTDIWKRIDDVIQKNTEIINNTIALEKKIAASHEKVKPNDLEKAFKIVRTEVKIDNPSKNIKTYKGKKSRDPSQIHSNESSDQSPIDSNEFSIKVERNSSSDEEDENSVKEKKDLNLISIKQPVISLVRVPIPIESVESDDNILSDCDGNAKEESRKVINKKSTDDKAEEKENEMVINEVIIKVEDRSRELHDENDSLDISFTSSEARDDEFDIDQSDQIKLEETETQPVKRKGRRRLKRPGRPKTTCLICKGPYEKSTGDWIKCNSCKKWAHETCADLNDSMYYYCPNCTMDKMT